MAPQADADGSGWAGSEGEIGGAPVKFGDPHLHVELREVLTSRRGIHVGDKMNTDYRGGRSA
jgi:hypothetical protein